MAVADPAMWEAFIEHLEKMITKKEETELRPLESGEMTISHRGAHTGWKLVDVTEAQAQSIRDEITSLRRTVDRVRKEFLEKYGG